MKYAACLLVAFACSGALASEPGQLLDCSDWIFVEPGLHCVQFTVAEPHEFFNRGASRAVDNSGRLLIVHRRLLSSPGGINYFRTEILALDGTAQTVLAYVDDRPAPGQPDRIRPTDEPSFSGTGTDVGGALTFDPVNGRLVVPLWRTSNCCLDWGLLAQFDGFARLFDVLQTYTPPNTLAVRVPAMPEGMAGADHFDTYWGNLTRPLDFTQAHSLQCDYPAAAPHVGDYLSVPDTVPTPAPGQGVYYVTSATYQGTTRYGRKTTGGVLGGRDPAAFAACADSNTPIQAQNPLRIAQLRWFDANRVDSPVAVMDSARSLAYDGDHVWVGGRDASGTALVVKLRASDAQVVGAFSTSGSEARAVAFDGIRIWVTDPNGTLTWLRASDGAFLGSTVLASGASQLVFDGEYIWVSGGSTLVAKVRASDGSIQGTFGVGEGSQGLAYDGTNIWVANFNGNTVMKLRRDDGAVLATVPVAPLPIALAFDGANLWVASRGNPGTVTKVRATDAVVLQTIPLSLEPTGVAFDGDSIWVSRASTNGVTRIRASDGAILGNFATGFYPRGVIFDGANIWTANTDGSVSKK